MELFSIKTHGPLSGTEDLYVRVEQGRFDPDSGCMEQGTVLSLHTYFNSFSCSQYLLWTQISSANAELELSGRFTVSVWAERAGQNVCLTEWEAKGPAKVPFSFSSEKGDCRYWIRLTALEKGCQFSGGRYTTDCHANACRIAVVICTYHREAYVRRNLDQISRELLVSSNPAVQEIEIFLIDNGQTLSGQIQETDVIHLIPNKNLGGSGGFTRGIIEVLKRKKDFTHILLMDDDVVIDPNTIFKTLQFMKLLRPGYQDLHLAGGMLTLENPYWQHEATARWQKGRNVPNHQLALDTVDALFQNEQNQTSDYGAWWYLCMPVSEINPDNLPLPLFIKCDDVEYGFRNIRHITVLNGIGVWHKGFDSKYAPWLDYYNTRNILILDVLHLPKKMRMNLPWVMLKRTLSYVACGMPQGGDFLYEGVRDYLKGPPLFLEMDQEEKNRKLRQKSASLGPLPELSKAQKMMRLTGKLFTPVFWKALWKCICLETAYQKNRSVVEAEWKYNWKSLTSLKYWEKLLEIEKCKKKL